MGLKIEVYEIFECTENDHMNGIITLIHKKCSKRGKGFAVFTINGKSEVGKMKKWTCKFKSSTTKNKYLWEFKELRANELPNDIDSRNKDYSSYITYTISENSIKPTPGSGTAGNTGGN